MIFGRMNQTTELGPTGRRAPTAGRADSILIVTLFFFSGAAGLIYEVLWGRMLGLEMGNTAYSLATILTVFMGGLALGSWIGGRYAHRVRNGLRVYGWMEIGIGLFCLALPHMIEALHPLMRWVYRDHYGSLVTFSLLQFLLCGAVLLLPVTLMGATLPIVAEHVTRRRDRIAGSIGLIYAVNTVGAFVGCMVCGLYLITELGITAANLTAAGLNLTVGTIAVLLASRAAPTAHLADQPLEPEVAPEAASVAEPPAAEAPEAPSPVTSPVTSPVASGPIASRTAPDPRRGIPIPVLLFGFGLSGFAAMAYQIAWTRAITLSTGSATYAFTLIVGAFILGLALGSAVLGALGENHKRTTVVLVSTQLLLVAFAWLVVKQLGGMPAWSASLLFEHAPDGKLPEDAHSAFMAIQSGTFRKLFMMVLPSTFVMGGTLPLVCKEISRRSATNVGAVLGRAYASNTVGTILGSFVAGFVLIPLVGMRGTIADAMFLNLSVGLIWFACAGWWTPRVRTTLTLATSTVVGLGALGLIVAHGLVAGGSLKPKQLQVLLPKWETSVMTSAPYIDGHMALGILKRMKGLAGEEWTTPIEEWNKYITERYTVVDYEEDVATTVTITIDSRQRLPELRVGGKVDARQWDTAQAMLAHLPLLLHPNPEDVLIVGLGSGGTLQSTLLHPSVQSVQDVEISGAVVRLSEKWFERSVPFNDPRAEIIVGDGRQHVAMTDRRYDVIVSQPSNPWIVGASALFTADCFEQMKARLKPGGIVCIWMQGFQVGSGPVKTLLKTFSSVFEHMDLWENMSREEYFLTGYLDPLVIDPARIEVRLRESGLAEQLDLLYVESAADLLGHYIGDREALGPFFESAHISTDDHNLLEAQIPKDLLLAKSTASAKELLSVRESVNDRVRLDPADPMAADFTRRAHDIFLSHPLAVDVFIGLRDEETTRNDILPQLYKLNPNDMFSKIYRAQLDDQLITYSNSFHGLYTNKAQALSKPDEFRELQLAVMLIKAHMQSQRFLYFELAPSAAPDKPEAQWIWRISFDDDATMVVDVYDLPVDPALHVAPWRSPVPLKGVNPDNIALRSGCRIALGMTDQGLYGKTQDDSGCAPTQGGGTHSFTEVLLSPANDAINLPQRLNYWERDVADNGDLAGGPSGALEFVLETKTLPPEPKPK